jgi:hypothetical protein
MEIRFMKHIFLAIILVTITVAETYKPRIIRSHGGGYRGAGRGIKESMGLSTIDASIQISIQLTSIAFTEASSNITSNQQRRREENSSELSFLKDNREKITRDISQGGGEHLVTLLNIMRLKRDKKSLAKIQSNFDKFLVLEDREFLSKLKSISNS